MSRIVVNGCFLALDDDAARHARSLVVALRTVLPNTLHLALPDLGIVSAPPSMSVSLPPRWQGATGLAWEQTELPALLRDDDVLLSLGGTGPPRRRHVLGMPTLAPTNPHVADVDLRRFIAQTQPGTARRAAAIVTESSSHATRIREDFGVDNVHVIPTGIERPFTTASKDETTAAAFRPYALGVGAHHHASRLDWLAVRWQLVARSTPLNLVLTTSGTVAGPPTRLPAGVHVVVDPPDAQLAQLYANAHMVVFPGASDPTHDPTVDLLRALATGTPFLAADSPTTRELAVAPDVQLLPNLPGQPPGWTGSQAARVRTGWDVLMPDPDDDLPVTPQDERWVARMLEWAQFGAPVRPNDLRTKAAGYTWRASAERLARIVRTVAA